MNLELRSSPRLDESPAILEDLTSEVATVGFGDFEWDEDKARSNLEKHGVSCQSRRKKKAMSNDETTQAEPSEASLAEMRK